MPELERLNAFIARVVEGRHVEAIEEFYHSDATMQENLAPPRRGRDMLVAHEQAALARIARMITHSPLHVSMNGDQVVIRWVFDVVGHDGTVRRLDELALQTWRGDRIAAERFYYDSATKWFPVEGGLSEPVR